MSHSPEASLQKMREAVWETTEPLYAADAVNPQLALSPWAGHRDFAYDLVSFVKPAILVELGVHQGCSFFAFCQAVKEHGLPTRVVGIDTWTGDPHAGFYSEDVFEQVQQCKSRDFADERFVLQRSTFQSALGGFKDGTLDLIHMDGLHTYEAVREDYQTWLPKLAPHGIMLFHDVAPTCGYESARFWLELKQEYPHFEFLHSWGLGVLFPKGCGWYDACLREHLPDKMRGYRYRAEYQLCNLHAETDKQWLKEQCTRYWRETQTLKHPPGVLLQWLLRRLRKPPDGPDTHQK
jgi:predicted O-methyltransferase YrrM